MLPLRSLILALALVSVNAQSDKITPTTTSTTTESSDVESSTEPFEELSDVCFPRLGCFNMSSPWRTLLRPLPAPDTPEDIQAKFYLFTRNQPKKTHLPTEPEILAKKTDYDGARKTYFITHGFTGDSTASWMVEMKNVILEKEDANVFLTDWGPGAAGPLNYLQVSSNTRVVAAEMAKLIEYLVQHYKTKPQNFHLIGHSLGAQISGYTGKRVKDIGKITALDPAQPAFEFYDRAVRLDSSDALFVEVVHTDAKPFLPLFGLGMMGSFGDVDFYINGGFTQPGCVLPKEYPTITSIADLARIPVSVIGNLVACPHGRSTLVYIEALRSTNCTFWGHPGNVVEKAIGALTRGYAHRYLTPSDEDCTIKNCAPMGFKTHEYPARGDFVVATTSNKPYCISEPEVDQRITRELASFVSGAAGFGADAALTSKDKATGAAREAADALGKATNSAASVAGRIPGISSASSFFPSYKRQ